jgi:hypothetical protein
VARCGSMSGVRVGWDGSGLWPSQLPAASHSARTALAGSPLPLCCGLTSKLAMERSRSYYRAIAAPISLLAFVKFAGMELFRMGRFAVTAMAAVKRKSHTRMYCIALQKRYFPVNIRKCRGAGGEGRTLMTVKAAGF